MNPGMVGTVSKTLAGTVTFRDAPIYAMLDSGQVVLGSNELAPYKDFFDSLFTEAKPYS